MFAACGVGSEERIPEAEIQKRLVIDGLGRQVVLSRSIERAVSLAPSLTEMIFAIGAGDRLVGVTTYCNYPAEATKIAKVGDTQTPNVEAIVALKPDVVFVSTASQLEAFMATLDSQGIAVYVIDSKDLDGVIRDLVKLGEVFELSEQANDVAVALNGRVSYIKHQASYDRSAPRKISEADKPRVFVQISRDPLYTIGKDSFLTELIETAGGTSVTKDIATAYPTLSKETALVLKPDVIVLSDSEDNREPNDVFKNSPAMKKGRVIRVNADIISRPGPRLVDALEQLAGELHPQETGEKN